MWLFAMFDLPMKTQAERRDYTRFRGALLRDGFCMLQYSVYARYCASDEAAEAHRAYVRNALAPHGQVRLLAVTDRQFGKMEIFFGKTRKATEDPPAQAPPVPSLRQIPHRGRVLRDLPGISRHQR